MRGDQLDDLVFTKPESALALEASYRLAVSVPGLVSHHQSGSIPNHSPDDNPIHLQAAEASCRRMVEAQWAVPELRSGAQHVVDNREDLGSQFLALPRWETLACLEARPAVVE
jgi:hypothetical protein